MLNGRETREGKIKNYYPYSHKTYFLNNYNLLLLPLLALGLFLGHWKGGAITGRSCVYLRVGILKMGWFCFCVFFFEHGCEGWWQQQFDSKAAKACGAIQHAPVPGGDTPQHSWKRWWAVTHTRWWAVTHGAAVEPAEGVWLKVTWVRSSESRAKGLGNSAGSCTSVSTTKTQ